MSFNYGIDESRLSEHERYQLKIAGANQGNTDAATSKHEKEAFERFCSDPDVEPAITAWVNQKYTEWRSQLEEREKELEPQEKGLNEQDRADRRAERKGKRFAELSQEWLNANRDWFDSWIEQNVSSLSEHVYAVVPVQTAAIAKRSLQYPALRGARMSQRHDDAVMSNMRDRFDGPRRW